MISPPETPVTRLEIPARPAHSAPLSPTQRRALVLSAEGLSGAQMRQELGIRPAAMIEMWGRIAHKIGVPSHPRRQAAIVFCALVHGELLDLPEPADPGPLPHDVLTLLCTLALGGTRRQYTADRQISVHAVTGVLHRTRSILETSHHGAMVYRASPQLLPLVTVVPALTADVVESVDLLAYRKATLFALDPDEVQSGNWRTPPCHGSPAGHHPSQVEER